MKYYTLSATVNGENSKLDRKYFSSREAAIEYMFKYFDRHYLFNLQVNDEYQIGDDKHDIEYVCDYYNRFRITRQYC